MTDTPEYSGGKTSYYMVEVTQPVAPTSKPYVAECQDIIEALGMDFNEGNAFKALWRRAAARLGKAKLGYTDGLYDAQKVEFYGKRLVQLHKEPLRVQCSGCGEPWLDEHQCAVVTERARQALAPENQRVVPVRTYGPKGRCRSFGCDDPATTPDGLCSGHAY